ncbi:hypothetical protein HYPSUDRAFT_200725 [Hypholoma sublateritium FD-334 SS-4]|uniref:Protein PNS1 n=1 Tax=Hypholoma sublateritium (strain FD-334 SS-4) TaxID=945553 RepID=A0A0D2LAJ1_HYPSF|nr:hypothetical protein HYPSUDRAFT_200725 [Hypholoma sublateritium FD-334 SS-4]
MASFAAYASQYINRPGSDTVSSSQPMFFSFTTDDGSRHAAHTDVEDLDDPHLHDADDPYLKLDESPPGWLAHLANSPRRSRSRSPSSGSDAPPPELLAQPARPQTKPPPPPPRGRPASPPHSPVGPTPLTESLLPRAGADVFSLPDPRHTPRKRRKHHDALWTALWLGAVSGTFVLCAVLLATTARPAHFPAAFLPYAVLLRTVPVLTLLTLLSAAAAYAHVWLLRLFAGPVLLATSVLVPATLFVSAVWAFVGSFMWDAGTEPTWGETVGLRLFALVPLTLCLITARRLLHLPAHIHRTSSTLVLATHLLAAHPPLAALSPALLLALLLASLPFLTAALRLLLIGYASGGATAGWEWHVRAYAHWGVAGVLGVWLWSWAVARGALRMAAASVVGAWYYSDPSLPPPPPMSTHTLHAALTRTAGPSLGTLCLSALLLTALRLLALLLLLLTHLPPALTALALPLSTYGAPALGAALAGAVARWVAPGVGAAGRYVERWKGRVSRYVLVYCGVTGVGFWEGAGRAGALVSGREVPVPVLEVPAQAGGRRTRARARARAPPDFGAEPSLALLTIAPLTLTLPAALLTYLFVAHTLRAPAEALGAALLAAGTTGMVGVFCVGLVRDW